MNEIQDVTATQFDYASTPNIVGIRLVGFSIKIFYGIYRSRYQDLYRNPIALIIHTLDSSPSVRLILSLA